VFRAQSLRVFNGANQGDPIGFADELQLDDIYRLSPTAALSPLPVIAGAQPPFQIAQDTTLGMPGADLHLDCIVTFMSGNGQTSEALILVETDEAGNIAQIYVQPLAPLSPKTEYVLVGINRDGALQRFAQIACVSFTGGTHITMANGAQRRVEDLRVGDRVLTRDDGPQEIRWMGHQTTRAVGDFAPIRITAGTLNNINDLITSPDHRLFIYQRTDELGAGRSEILVRARHLVNGDTVHHLPGGFVDYYQMLFDSHQIVYAEGIAAESMLVDTVTSAALPAEMDDKLNDLLPGHHKTDHRSLEVQEGLLARPDAAELLKKSSMS
jgi:hypothetical protein